MTSQPIIAQIITLRQRRRPRQARTLRELAQHEAQLPQFVRQSPIAMRYLRFLGPPDWDRFPERDLSAGHPMETVRNVL